MTLVPIFSAGIKKAESQDQVSE